MVPSQDAPVPGKLEGHVGSSTAPSESGGSGMGTAVIASAMFSGHLVLVLSTLPSVATRSIAAGSQVTSKQSLYVTTHHGSHLTPHQLSISMINSTSGSHEERVSSLKYNVQGSSGQGVAVGSGVGSGVGLGVGTGVGSGVGRAVGESVMASAIGGIVGWGVGAGVGLGVGNRVGGFVGGLVG